jgi:hypothetical protein
LTSRIILLHVEYKQVARFWIDGGEKMIGLLGPVTVLQD